MEFQSSHTAPLPTAVRQRLQKVFEHARRCMEKNDHNYANQLFTQCVVEDPSNLIYLQSFVTNLHKKYGNNKKGAKLAGLKTKSLRSKFNRAAAKGEWEPAMQASCAAIALNPWDITMLLAVSAACDQLRARECQLYYLRLALDADPKSLAVNRQAGRTLQQMGQFDQAIACWQRVKLAEPQDEESAQAISHLSVEKAIRQGGYNPSLLEAVSEQNNANDAKQSVAQLSINANSDENQQPSQPLEERLIASIREDPTDVENYIEWIDLLMHENRLADVEQVLGRATEIAGNGNLRICERREDWQIRRVHHLLAIAEKRYEEDSNDESRLLAEQIQAQARQVELEVYTAKSDRNPQNTRLKFELGMRLKQAGKPKDAITAFQAARSDPKQKALALLHLGECFQHIEQYKLAMTNYKQAIEACSQEGVGDDSETKKQALYRAGVLATGLRELDWAEQHLTELAGIDFGYRDVADRLDKIGRLRDS